MARVTRLFSFWAAVAFAALGLLQLFPYTGIILMVLGGALWCGLAVHAFLIGIAIDAMFGRLPRFLVIVPLLAYGAYYKMYYDESREIAVKAAELRSQNPSRVMPFDPERNALVLPRERAERVASYDDVPVTFEVRADYRPEGFLSHRLLGGEQCGNARDGQARLRAAKMRAAIGLVTPVRDNDKPQGYGYTTIPYVCLLNVPEKPEQPQIVVTRHGDEAVWRHQRGVLEQTTEFSLDGRTFATYRTASVWRLSPLPLLLIGCALNSGAPSWDCFANFNRTLEAIDTTPANVDAAGDPSPEAIVLGLRKLKPEDYDAVKASKRWQALIEQIDNYPRQQAEFEANHKADLFAQFVEFVRDTTVETTGSGVLVNLNYKGNINPPPEMEGAILAGVDQLLPLRDAIVARFVQLAQAKIAIHNKWFRLLDKSLVAMPREAFAGMPDDEVTRLLDALGAYRGWDYFRELYLRMTEAGPRTIGFYESELEKLQNRGASKSLVPELAICRLGQADEPTRAILRREFADTSKTDRFDDPVDRNSAVFATLLRLGDIAVADGMPASFQREDVVSWYEAVRQGKGKTEVGPNNCNGWGRNGFRDANWWRRFPPPLRARLVYQDKAWVETDVK